MSNPDFLSAFEPDNATEVVYVELDGGTLVGVEVEPVKFEYMELENGARFAYEVD